MEVSVCVGSSCHLKGSYNIIQLMKTALSKHQLEEKVNLAARLLPWKMYRRRFH